MQLLVIITLLYTHIENHTVAVVKSFIWFWEHFRSLLHRTCYVMTTQIFCKKCNAKYTVLAQKSITISKLYAIYAKKEPLVTSLMFQQQTQIFASNFTQLLNNPIYTLSASFVERNPKKW